MEVLELPESYEKQTRYSKLRFAKNSVVRSRR